MRILENTAAALTAWSALSLAPWLDAQPASAACPDKTVAISGAPSGWNGWSPSPSNTRFQNSDAAGLTVDQVRKLKLKWAFGFEGRSEEHTSELQSRFDLVCRLL